MAIQTRMEKLLAKIPITLQRTKFGFEKNCKKRIKCINYFYISNNYRKSGF